MNSKPTWSTEFVQPGLHSNILYQNLKKKINGLGKISEGGPGQGPAEQGLKKASENKARQKQACLGQTRKPLSRSVAQLFLIKDCLQGWVRLGFCRAENPTRDWHMLGYCCALSYLPSTLFLNSSFTKIFL